MVPPRPTMNGVRCDDVIFLSLSPSLKREREQRPEGKCQSFIDFPARLAHKPSHDYSGPYLPLPHAPLCAAVALKGPLEHHPFFDRAGVPHLYRLEIVEQCRETDLSTQQNRAQTSPWFSCPYGNSRRSQSDRSSSRPRPQAPVSLSPAWALGPVQRGFWRG